MSLSASSMMSRVKSLMVSRVMELFWRRCLHVWRDVLNWLSWSRFTFDKLLFPMSNYLLQSLTLRSNYLAYLATFLLDSLLPELNWGGGDKTTGKLVRKWKRDRGRTLSPDIRPPTKCFFVEAKAKIYFHTSQQSNKNTTVYLIKSNKCWSRNSFVWLTVLQRPQINPTKNPKISKSFLNFITVNSKVPKSNLSCWRAQTGFQCH